MITRITKLRGRVHSYKYINKRIITAKFRIDQGYLTIIGIYSPEEGRNEDTENFYDLLHSEIFQMNKSTT